MMTLTEKDKKQLAILAALLIVFAVATKSSFSRVKKSQDKAKKAQLMKTFVATGVITPAMTKAGIPAEAGAAGTSAQSSGIDPFTGRAISIGIEEMDSKLKLSGIVYNPKDTADCYAIINNCVVKIGETIPNTQLKVVDMSGQEVSVSDGKMTVKLKTW